MWLGRVSNYHRFIFCYHRQLEIYPLTPISKRLLNKKIGDMYTYEQNRIGLSYAYLKGQVQNDGITIEPLNI